VTREELVAIQAPIIERYQNNPKEAAATLSGSACLGADVTNTITIGKQTIETGLHAGLGGIDSNICPGELFLSSLAACSGITLSAVATHMGLNIRDGRITAIGSLDLRGTLGVDPAVPVGFRSIELKAELETDASAQDIEMLLEMTEKYCVVFQTMVSPPKLRIQRKGE
jgi:uncharacterized OsmC-like protein